MDGILMIYSFLILVQVKARKKEINFQKLKPI